MRTLIAVAAAACLLDAAAWPARAEPAPVPAVQTLKAPEFSAQQKKKKRTRASQATGGHQIACTYLGCQPIPRGCRIVTGRIPFTWEPSGFDEVVCPYPR
jgi:hypothetical protein